MSLCVEHLQFSYGSREVLREISFTAEQGELLSVLGPNGVGKSTLFQCLLGLLAPKVGMVTVDGRNVQDMTAAERSRCMAYIPQAHHPVFNFSVLDMVLMGTTSQVGRFSVPGKAQMALAEEALERLGIAHLRDRGCAHISGGERQLVLIARAIAQQAKILVMDEPSANLDFGHRVRVMQVMKELTKDGYTVIQSTHDPDQAYLYSDKILALYDGRVLGWGTPREVVREELVSTLYGVPVEVCSMQEDRVRVCIAK